jgi:hypothetical protein
VQRGWHGDREVDVHLSLFDHHPLDDQADEPLAGLEGQRGQRATDAAREGLETRLKLRPLHRHGVFLVDRRQAGLHVCSLLTEQSLPALELIERDEPGLVGVQQPMPLSVRVSQLLGQSPHLRRDQVVRARQRQGAHVGVRLQNQGRALQMTAHLPPDEAIQFIGTKIPLRAPPEAPPRAEHVVPGAVVIVVEGPVPAAHPVAGDTEVAHSAADEAPQQVVP